MKLSYRSAAAATLLLAAGPGRAWTTEPPPDYGRVVLANFAPKAGMAPAQFDHWRHRARYTCRVCHVDLGFAMSPGATRVSATTNRAGFHCGSCHNGTARFAGKPVFGACGTRATPDDDSRCQRCHSRGDAAARRKDFEEFAAGLPRIGTARDVDWEKAEAKGAIHPADGVEGVSIPRRPIQMDKEVAIASRGWTNSVIFSHKKHAVWNGCEVCHPDIYPHTQGAARSSMLEISSGASCGACHGKVAFSLGECERCHLNPVR